MEPEPLGTPRQASDTDWEARGTAGPQAGWAAREEPCGQAGTDRNPARRIIVHALPHAESELSALRDCLLRPQARIAPKFFYDTAGCALFAEICRLPEYYLTRTEDTIFKRHRQQIAACVPAQAQWVDLGCGDGAKSRQWMDASAARRFVGVDIAHDCLAGAVDAMERQFPLLECLGIVTDLALPLRLHPILAERPAWPAVFFYPGSSLGNFTPAAAAALLRAIRGHMDGSGCLLIGIDLVKEAALLEAAYNDAQGVTAAFNRNILRVVNRLLGANFDPDGFEHCAHFAAATGRIEMRLRARAAQAVRIGRDIRHFAAGETILTEYSHKYTVDGFLALLGAAGFSRLRLWTDEQSWFGVFLAQP